MKPGDQGETAGDAEGERGERAEPDRQGGAAGDQRALSAAPRRCAIGPVRHPMLHARRRPGGKQAGLISALTMRDVPELAAWVRRNARTTKGTKDTKIGFG